MLNQIRTAFAQFGIGTGLLYSISYLLNKVSPNCGLYYYLIARQPIKQKPLLPKKLGKQYQIAALESADPVLAALGRPEAVIRDRFAQRSIALVATKEDQFVGCVWLVFNKYIEDEVRSHFHLEDAASSAWDYDVFVAPEERSTLLFAKLWTATNELLKERGVTHTFSRISGFNLPSVKSHQRLGAEIVEKIVYVKLWRLQLMLGSSRPWVHVSFSEQQVPQLSIR